MPQINIADLFLKRKKPDQTDTIFLRITEKNRPPKTPLNTFVAKTYFCNKNKNRLMFNFH